MKLRRRTRGVSVLVLLLLSLGGIVVFMGSGIVFLAQNQNPSRGGLRDDSLWITDRSYGGDVLEGIDGPLREGFVSRLNLKFEGEEDGRTEESGIASLDGLDPRESVEELQGLPFEDELEGGDAEDLTEEFLQQLITWEDKPIDFEKEFEKRLKEQEAEKTGLDQDPGEGDDDEEYFEDFKAMKGNQLSGASDAKDPAAPTKASMALDTAIARPVPQGAAKLPHAQMKMPGGRGTGIFQVTLQIDPTSTFDPLMFPPPEVMTRHQAKFHPELSGRSVVLLASFPHNGNHYLRNLVLSMGLVTHSLHRETPFEFAPLNTTFIISENLAKTGKLPGIPASPALPFFVKTHFPAVESRLLPVGYNSLIWLIRNPIDNLYEHAKFQPGPLTTSKLMEILPQLIEGFKVFHLYWEVKCSLVKCLKLRLEDLLLDPNTQQQTLANVAKFLNLGTPAGGEGGTELEGDAPVDPKAVERAFREYPAQRGKVGEGLKVFTTRGIRLVMNELGEFLQQFGYTKLVKGFLETAKTRELRRKQQQEGREKTSKEDI